MTTAAAPLSSRLTATFDMARRIHDTKAIKGTDLPYLLHLLDVCSIALRHGADEDQAIAALLHDVVEDGGGAPMVDEIRSEFGDRVAGIVLACSDSLVEDAADKLSNTRAILTDLTNHGDALWARFNTGRAGTLWYYRTIADILPGRLPRSEGGNRLGQALASTVADLVEKVGAEAAASDWRLALVEVDKVRTRESLGYRDRPVG